MYLRIWPIDVRPNYLPSKPVSMATMHQGYGGSDRQLTAAIARFACVRSRDKMSTREEDYDKRNDSGDGESKADAIQYNDQFSPITLVSR